MVQAPTLVINDLEIRIAERKAALAQRQHEKALWDGVDIAVLCIEFLSVFVALMFGWLVSLRLRVPGSCWRST